jgi:hypothetical protein
VKYEALVNVTIGGLFRKAGETFTAEPGLVHAADIRDGLVRDVTAPAPAPVSAIKPKFKLGGKK